MRASESDRGIICPASLVLPRNRERSESSKKALAWGTLVHHWKETGETAMPGASDADIKCLNKKLVMSGVTREAWWSLGEHEVTFAIRLDRHPRLCHVERYSPKCGVPRDDWKARFPGGWLTGTIDYLRPDRLDDLKTGHWPVDVRTAKQLRSYAMLPWIEAGAPDDWEYLVSITHWERYPLAGQPRRTYDWISGAEMRFHLADLLYAMDHLDETNPTEDGCRFCDCRPDCPEWAN